MLIMSVVAWLRQSSRCCVPAGFPIELVSLTSSYSRKSADMLNILLWVLKSHQTSAFDSQSAPLSQCYIRLKYVLYWLWYSCMFVNLCTSADSGVAQLQLFVTETGQIGKQ